MASAEGSDVHARADARAGKRARRRFGVIGFGAIGDEIVRCLETRRETDALAGFLVRPQRISELARKGEGRFPIVSELDGLFALGDGHGHYVTPLSPLLLRSGFEVLRGIRGELRHPLFVVANGFLRHDEDRVRFFVPVPTSVRENLVW